VSATGNEKRARGLKTVPDTEAHLNADDLDALPEGTARAFTLAQGIALTFEKTGDGYWRVHTRGRIPSRYLAAFPSAERVRRGGGE
jgi:hypothetical protein